MKVDLSLNKGGMVRHGGYRSIQPEFPVGPHGLDQYTPVLAAIRSIFHLCRCLCSNPTQARGAFIRAEKNGRFDRYPALYANWRYGPGDMALDTKIRW
jgi:hypothetical protein